MFGIDDAIIGGAASALSSAGSGLLNTLVGINQSRINRQFQRDMSGTAYQRAMADMRAAGLNPMLAYQQGGASTPPGSNAGSGSIDLGISSALNYKMQREEQDNRNRLAAANASLTEAKAAKEKTTVPAYEWGENILKILRPYADDVVGYVNGKLRDWTKNPTTIGDDLAAWAKKHNLGVMPNMPDPLKAETWTNVGKAISDAIGGAVTKGVTSAKQTATETLSNAQRALKNIAVGNRNTISNSYLLKKHDTSPLSAKDPALSRLPGVPKD